MAGAAAEAAVSSMNSFLRTGEYSEAYQKYAQGIKALENDVAIRWFRARN